MAPKKRKVVFARINRRRATQDTLAMRSFGEDMRVLAQSRLTQFVEPGSEQSPGKTWIAGDMSVDTTGDFMSGTLGFSEKAERREFDSESWSWVKGPSQVTDTGAEDTVVPFAVDLRNAQRWVAFSTAARLQAPSFVRGLGLVLAQAAVDAQVIGTEWEVDLITSRASIYAWLRDNPEVKLLRRTIKFSNPGRDLDDDRTEMQALLARRKTEEFAAPRGRSLDTKSPLFLSKLDGTETGDLELELRASGRHDVTEATFKSVEQADCRKVDDFGRDLMYGMEIVLGALREYVVGKGVAPGYGADGHG